MDTPWKAEFQEFVNTLRAKYGGQVIAVCCAYVLPGDDTPKGHMARIEIDVAGIMEMGPQQYAAAFAGAAEILRSEMESGQMKPWPKAN